MRSLSTSLNNYIASIDPEKVRLLKAAQHNARFEAALKRTWRDSPDSADYLLAHINSLYFAADKSPRKGQLDDTPYIVLGLYMDESTAKAEINARRERLCLELKKDGYNFDELRIHTSTFGMKERHAFPQALEKTREVLGGKKTRKAERSAKINTEIKCSDSQLGHLLLIEDESRLLEIFKKALCQACGDIDAAVSILNAIEGAALSESKFNAKKRKAKASFFLTLYTSEEEKMLSVIAALKEGIIARAKTLGLNLIDISLKSSPETLKGQCAFPLQGKPRPLQSLPWTAN